MIPAASKAIPRAVVGVVDTIDTMYGGHKQAAAAYLLPSKSTSALIDNNTNDAIPHIIKVVESRQTKVSHLIVTHVHLDHAGATSNLARLWPDAAIVAHPRAARHLIDPTRLIQGVKAVYGEETFKRLYGELYPIDEKRVHSVSDGESMTVGDRTLTFIHTRGHANHHMIIVDKDSKAVFTGDSFGICLPPLQQHGLFMYPTTSPTDYDPIAAKEVVEKIAGMGLDVYPTHFGMVPASNVKAGAAQLLEHLTWAESETMQAMKSTESLEDLSTRLAQAWRDRLKKWLMEHGHSEDQAKFGLKLCETDCNLNGQGMAWTAVKMRS